MTAWLAANIMNASGNLKRPITIQKLLGRPPGRERKKSSPPMTKDEMQKEFEKLVKEMKETQEQ